MKTTNIILSAALLAGTCFPVLADQELHLKWVEKDGKQYWYENGEIQGKEGDDKNITDEIYGIERGREIYDPASDAWYWLDANNGGAKAVNKEVWMPYVYQDETPGSTEGKWVRYDEEGKMIKGWFIDGDDHVYYYDPVTGAMAKNHSDTDGTGCTFDSVTGILNSTDDQNYALLLNCEYEPVMNDNGNRLISMKEVFTDTERSGITDVTAYASSSEIADLAFYIDEKDWNYPNGYKNIVYLDGRTGEVFTYFLGGSFQTSEDIQRVYDQALKAKLSGIEANRQLHKLIYVIGENSTIVYFYFLSNVGETC